MKIGGVGRGKNVIQKYGRKTFFSNVKKEIKNITT